MQTYCLLQIQKILSHYTSPTRTALAADRLENPIYKIITVIFNTLHVQAPPYLANLLHLQTATQTTRSADTMLLRVPSLRLGLVTAGDRVFQKGAPLLWNGLPTQIRLISDPQYFKALRTIKNSPLHKSFQLTTTLFTHT